MVNVNVFDKVCDAVEDYNQYVSRRGVGGLTPEEMKGLFYNCLRRIFGTLARHRRDTTSLRSDDIQCTFDSNGKLLSFKITKDFKASYCDWDIDLERLTTLRLLKEAVNEHKKFYPTKELNDMARIINSIKTT